MDNNNEPKSVRTYRLTDKTIEQLQELSEYYVRTMSEQIEWMVRESYRIMNAEIEKRKIENNK
jgi:hypothetical protein